MEQLKQKKTSPILGFLMIFMLLLTSIFTTVSTPVKAKAEETNPPLKVQTIIDNMTFITFTKGENASYGQHVFGCFYIPDTVYNESFEYGVIVFPRWYAERYGVTGNYIEEYTALGLVDTLAILLVNKPTSLEDGKLLKCGITNIPDEGEDIELAYIFFARDIEENIAYATPRHAAYSNPLIGTYTNDEIALMIGKKVLTDNSFKQIVTKLEELVDSFWTYIIMAGAAVVVVWGAVIGIRIAVAKGKDEQINARAMLKNLVIGVIVVFVIAVAAPMLIKGLSSWIAW